MNTTKAIIILVVFITGLILGYQRFVVNAPEQGNEATEKLVLPPQIISLGVGQTGQFMGLQIRLNEVVQDVRCPIDVECIEAGAINTNLSLQVGDTYQEVFYASDGVPLTFQGYNISIQQVLPPLQSETTIDQSQYQIDFYVASEMQETVDVPNQEETPSQKEISPLGYACMNAGGQWSQEFSECLGLSGESCSQIGGTWNECASACRNNPDAEVCTLQCVQVCEL